MAWQQEGVKRPLSKAETSGYAVGGFGTSSSTLGTSTEVSGKGQEGVPVRKKCETTRVERKKK